MRLFLTQASPLDSAYHDETGRTLYRVATPVPLAGRTTFVARVLSHDGRLAGGEEEMPWYTVMTEKEIRDADDRIARYGQSARLSLGPEGGKRYACFGRIDQGDRITIRGVEHSQNILFTKKGWGYYGRNRIFNGPDRREYKWKMDKGGCTLTLVDKSKQCVARYHPVHYDVYGDADAAYLEILPPADVMLDFVLITFVFIEDKRMRRERLLRRGDPSSLSHLLGHFVRSLLAKVFPGP
ncbi:hypothetical protein BD626DRAFT_635107 [Schizophyllum amplum]|uniref:DUF6593 domain-containing protein n=1 Tax=Schizophyllum amplum TaxID=97359 RepID=A0A550BX73_9AGAR|nr:hypothetical protein BD626DRAFT_635107 [Auriculariopsis ampla]